MGFVYRSQLSPVVLGFDGSAQQKRGLVSHVCCPVHTLHSLPPRRILSPLPKKSLVNKRILASENGTKEDEVTCRCPNMYDFPGP